MWQWNNVFEESRVIKDGGYATSLTYVEDLCSIIERWNLTQFDAKESETAIAWYRVRKTWADSKTQKGAYKILENAKKCADANPGYSVFDVNGVNIYTPKTTAPAASVDVPFLVRITITDLNIRKFLQRMLNGRNRIWKAYSDLHVDAKN